MLTTDDSDACVFWQQNSNPDTNDNTTIGILYYYFVFDTESLDGCFAGKFL